MDSIATPRPVGEAEAPLLDLPDVPIDARSRDRAIPIRPGDLTRMLAAEPGLAPTDRLLFGQFARLLGAILHYEFLHWLNELKDLYAPLDPDTDCVDLEQGTPELTEGSDEAFLKPFEAALVRANYRPLKMEVLEHAIRAPNEMGLNYIPNFALFEHLKVYVRGHARIARVVRGLRTGFKRREVLHPGYQRMILILKFRPHAKLDHYVRTDVLYLRLFKDVPHVDMEMHLPEQGTRVQMRAIDKAQIASPFVTFPTTLALKAIGGMLGLISLPTLAIGGILAAPITAGVNSFFGFRRAKQRHLHYMIRHLYYLTLANNASVITRLVDCAEEEEYKEALLAYYILWRRRDEPEPWTSARLDAAVEDLIKAKAGLAIDFEVADALAKLSRLGLAQADGQGRLRAVALDEALATLDRRWDDYFGYNVPDPVDTAG